MSRTARIPGAIAAPTPEPVDDLALIDDSPLPTVDPVQAQLAEMSAELRRLKRGQSTDPRVPTARGVDAQSQAQAKAMAEAQIRAGTRPRALLTPDGWYVHPESARVPGSLGNTKA